jgi:epoxide hydrolase-like predicted phosphatase
MTIRAVIWDLGGVIVRTEDPIPRTGLAQRFGLTREELEELVFHGEVSDRATVGEIVAAQLWQSICENLRVPPTQAEELQRGFWGGDQLDTALVDYIRALRPNYCTALLSNAWSDLRRFLTERWRIVDAFDEIIISAEVGLMKPDPSIFQLAVERLNVAPAEAVFIDDFALNVRAAQQAGLHAVRFRNPAQAREELETLLQNNDSGPG